MALQPSTRGCRGVFGFSRGANRAAQVSASCSTAGCAVSEDTAAKSTLAVPTDAEKGGMFFSSIIQALLGFQSGRKKLQDNTSPSAAIFSVPRG